MWLDLRLRFARLCLTHAIRGVASLCSLALSRGSGRAFAMRSELRRAGTAGSRTVMVGLETVVERGICNPKRLSKIAGKLVFKAPHEKQNRLRVAFMQALPWA